MDGIQLSQDYSHYEETVYFLPLNSQEVLVLIWSTTEGWKAESTLVLPSGFEPGTRDWESSALTARPLLHVASNKKQPFILIKATYWHVQEI